MNNIRNYRYKVMSTKGQWEEWTGTFNSLDDAKEWHRTNGSFHEYRGYKLQLFGRSKQSQEIPIN
jgi:hypothetical protein